MRVSSRAAGCVPCGRAGATLKSLPGKTVGVAALIAVLVSVGPLSAQSRPDQVRAEALTTYFHGITAEIAQERIGPEGVPALLELLADPTFPRRDNVVAFLGFLGGSETTSAILGRLAGAASPQLTAEEDRALLLLPLALGQIAGRGDQRALAALMDMTAAGSGGGAIARAAARGPRPAALRDDLLHMAVRGLGYVDDPRALARLRSIERGELRPVQGGRDLRSSAAIALEMGASVRGSSGPIASRWVPRTGSGGENDVSPLDVTDADASSEAPSLTDGTAGLGPDALVERVFDPVHSNLKLARLTFGSHAGLGNPMTIGRADAILNNAARNMGRANFQGDVACCATIARLGNANMFGSPTDGLDIIDTSTELTLVLNNTVGRVKVVRQINYCPNAPGAVNLLGCSWVAGNGMAVVRVDDVMVEGALWAHEFGHNTSLQHNPDANYIMHERQTASSVGLTQTECGKYHSPSAGTQIAMVDLGLCTDNDVDEVQDQIDNCPQIANNNQTDTDGDGIGDLCDGTSPTPTPQPPTATPSRTPTPGVTPSATATRTPTPSATATRTATPSATATPTATRTATPNPTSTRTSTATPTASASATPTRTATRTATPTPNPTGTGSPSPSATPSRTGTATPTRTSTSTATPGATSTRTATPTPTRTPTASATFTATRTPTRTPTVTPTPTTQSGAVLDIDDNGDTDPFTDGMLGLRWQFGLTGEALVDGAVATNCKRCTGGQVDDYLTEVVDQIDIDGDGQIKALSDGVLALRWLFGLTGEPLIHGAVNLVDCTRCTAEQIEPYLLTLE